MRHNWIDEELFEEHFKGLPMKSQVEPSSNIPQNL